MSATVRLVYVADPMCSWCWGFAPEFQQIREKYAGQWEIDLLMGGLRPGTTEVVDTKMKGFLREHWEEIGERTNQPFAFDILERDDFVYDTEPAARAVVVVKHLFPDHYWEMFKAVQYAFYAENKDTNLPETFRNIVDSLGLEVDRFDAEFHSPDARTATQAEFALAREMGINGFPSVALFTDERGYLLSRGYATFAELEAQIGHIKLPL